MTQNQPDFVDAGRGNGVEARLWAFRWSDTSLGPMEDWPAPLRATVDLLLSASQPMFLVAGDERRLVYNNGFVPLLGRRHPDALARPLLHAWPEMSLDLAAAIDACFRGERCREDDVRLVVRTHGFPEERRFSFAFTPVTDGAGTPIAVVCACNEITRQGSVQQRLRHAMQMLELAWEAARGAVFEHAVPMDGPTYYSDQWGEMLGYPQEELPSHEQFIPWLFERIHPDDQGLVERSYRDFMEGRRPAYRVEVRIRHRDGHWVWVRGVNTALERNPDGTVRRLVGMALDITDLKNTEQALREREAQFREMANGLPLIIWVHDASGALELVNDTVCEFFGLPREALYGDQWQARLHPEDKESYLAELRAGLEQRRPTHAEARFKAADGQWRNLESWARPRFTSSGELRALVGGSVDVTERRRAEAALREEEERFRTLADNIAQFAWMADAEGRIFWWNRRWFDYTGLRAEEMNDPNVWGRIHHPDHWPRVREKFLRCLESGEPWEDTFPLLGRDGRWRWFLSRALPIHDEAGRVVRWFGTNTDITEQRAYAERLRESERQMSEFLAMLGHELRNPLAAVRSAAELVSLAEPNDPRLQRAWTVLERQSTHMTRLIDSLLEVSRIARGKIKLDRKILDLRKVIEDVLQDRSAQLASSGLELRKHLPQEPLWVSGDDVRLAQIFDNLLGNALKFTDAPGALTVTLRAENGQAVVELQDTGAGIRPEMLATIFEPFQQETQDISRSVGGLGLGLALVKGLVELHEGSVTAESAGPGTGATFTVRLPQAMEPSAKAHAEPPSGPVRRHILLVEDNADAADMMQLVLEMQGHEVRVAPSGREALELLRREETDIVLCDIGLPDMSGYDLAETVRADPLLCDIPLVAITGYGRSTDRHRTREAGFCAHLTKPVELATLVDVLARLGGDEPPAA